jgi:uncharacterized membrane protein YgcG
MKKIISLFFAVCMFAVLSLNAFAADIYLNDSSGIFTSAEKERLSGKMKELADYKGWNIAIVTKEGSFSESEAETEIDKIFTTAFGNNAKGTAYLMTGKPGDNDFQLVMEAYGGATISDKSKVLDRAERRFTLYDEAGSAELFLKAVESSYSASKNNGNTAALRVVIRIIVICGIVIAAITIANGTWSNNASDYSRRGDFGDSFFGGGSGFDGGNDSGGFFGGGFSGGGRSGKR